MLDDGVRPLRSYATRALTTICLAAYAAPWRPRRLRHKKRRTVLEAASSHRTQKNRVMSQPIVMVENLNEEIRERRRQRHETDYRLRARGSL